MGDHIVNVIDFFQSQFCCSGTFGQQNGDADGFMVSIVVLLYGRTLYLYIFFFRLLMVADILTVIAGHNFGAGLFLDMGNAVGCAFFEFADQCAEFASRVLSAQD